MRLRNSSVRTLVAALTLVMLFVLAPNTSRSQEAAPPRGAEVKIDNFSFGPQSLEIPLNTTITWINRDDIPHTVVSDDGVFRSKALDTDDKFSFTFSKPGTYRYFCGLHPKMVGKITVQ